MRDFSALPKGILNAYGGWEGRNYFIVIKSKLVLIIGKERGEGRGGN